MSKSKVKEIIIKFSPGVLIFLLSTLRNKFTNRQKAILNFAILNNIDQICDLLKVPYKKYIAAMVITESSGDPNETGSLNEVGLLQIYEPTFNRLNRKYNFSFTFQECYAIQPNLYVGILLFRDNLKTLNYDYFDAIKAHNVGTDLKPKEAATKYLKKVLQNAK